MALSPTESALLTQTCENMNIAANTCREVLEMLRSLGNTGVVDIATHNNTAGAHASDKTLVHAALSDGNSKATINLAPVDTITNGNACAIIAYPEGYSMRHEILTKQATGPKTNRLFERFEQYLSDDNGTRVDFADTTLSTSSMHSTLSLFTSYLTDASGNQRSTALRTLPFSMRGGSGCTSSFMFSCSDSEYSQSIVFEVCGDGIIPYNDNAISLGKSSYAYKDIFLKNQPTVSSDRRIKRNIASLGSEAVAFVKALRPVRFRLAEGEGGRERFDGEDKPLGMTQPAPGSRTHWGLIAQEVKEAMEAAGIDDAALWCLADKDDPESAQSLRYSELIAPMIKCIQNQQERIEALERKMA